MQFDMVRVRQDGCVVPRHNVGLLRAVRGSLRVADKFMPDLRRHSRTALFTTEGGTEVLELHDVALMHINDLTMVLSGFERGFHGLRAADFAQTWILEQSTGETPQASRGPAHLG